MAKFFGKLGFSISVELDPINEPGVYGDTTIERDYTGEKITTSARWEPSSELNDNFNLNCKFSILLDPFAEQYHSKIKYVEYLGTKWKVTGIVPKYPRIELSVGGIYNGDQSTATQQT